jgi:imidazolonepropionase
VLLPLTSFYLNKPFAKARAMIDYGCAVALASDYNPGSSPSENLQLAMQFAVLKMKMTPEEALTAVTVNAAKASGLEATKGRLMPGMDADFVVLAAPNLDYFFYRFGINLVEEVYIKGKKVK